MILIIIVSLGTIIPVRATECAHGGGVEIRGNDGTNYCLSNSIMNWWSAFAWCDAAGKKLISMETYHGRDSTHPILILPIRNIHMYTCQ